MEESRQLQPGSDADFDYLYRTTYPRIVRALTAMMRSPSEAEDCAQDAYARAYKAWPKWRPDAPAEAWLWRIALNVARNRMRYLKVHPFASVAKLFGSASDSADPAQAATQDDVHQSLLRLRPKDRQAIVLRHLHGFSAKEIAELFGVNVRNVNRWLERAEAELRDQLGEAWRNDEQIPVKAGP